MPKTASHCNNKILGLSADERCAKPTGRLLHQPVGKIEGTGKYKQSANQRSDSRTNRSHLPIRSSPGLQLFARSIIHAISHLLSICSLVTKLWLAYCELKKKSPETGTTRAYCTPSSSHVVKRFPRLLSNANDVSRSMTTATRFSLTRR